MNLIKKNKVDKDGFIKDLASGINRFFISKYGEIDPELIAIENEITYCYGDYGNYFDGRIEFCDSSFHIFINTKGYSNNYRSKFTFAHELGHFYIPEHANALVNGDSPNHSSYTGFKSKKFIERQADYFAANLLMPENQILSIYRNWRKFSFEIITELQNKFQVSILASLYRIFILDLHPLIIVMSKNGKVIKKPMRNKDFFHKFYEPVDLPKESPAYTFFKHGIKSNQTKELWTLDWFDTDKIQKMYEHCVFYERQNIVYSILWTD